MCMMKDSHVAALSVSLKTISSSLPPSVRAKPAFIITVFPPCAISCGLYLICTITVVTRLSV